MDAEPPVPETSVLAIASHVGLCKKKKTLTYAHTCARARVWCIASRDSFPLTICSGRSSRGKVFLPPPHPRPPPPRLRLLFHYLSENASLLAGPVGKRFSILPFPLFFIFFNFIFSFADGCFGGTAMWVTRSPSSSCSPWAATSPL